MTRVVGTSLMILLLVMGALFSGLPIYATTEGGNESSGDEGGGGSSDEGGGSSDKGTESEPEQAPPTEEEPKAEAPPEQTNEPVTGEGGDANTCMGGQPGTDGCPPAADTTELPKCDGTPQDCTTRNGDICKAGEGGEKCECLPDMSDCPNHPSLLQGNTSVPLALQSPSPELPPECKEGQTPLECLGDLVGEPDCLPNQTPLECLQDYLNRPSIEPTVPNPDFNPDGDCLFDTQLPKCHPGEGQECPTGFSMNEDGNCFPRHSGCPENYHGHEDDETGECISNDIPCQSGYEMNEAGTNCEREHFTCDGKPSVVECKDKDNKHNGDHKNDGKRNLVIKHFHDTKIINRIIESTDDLDVAQTIVAISYDEGAGINCVISNDNQGQCETFDVNKDAGKEPFLAVIPFS